MIGVHKDKNRFNNAIVANDGDRGRRERSYGIFATWEDRTGQNRPRPEFLSGKCIALGKLHEKLMSTSHFLLWLNKPLAVTYVHLDYGHMCVAWLCVYPPCTCNARFIRHPPRPYSRYQHHRRHRHPHPHRHPHQHQHQHIRHQYHPPP